MPKKNGKPTRYEKREMKRQQKADNKLARIDRRQSSKEIRVQTRQEGKSARTAERQDPEAVAARQAALGSVIDTVGGLGESAITAIGGAFGGIGDAAGAIAGTLDQTPSAADAPVKRPAPEPEDEGMPPWLIPGGVGLAVLALGFVATRK